MAVKYLDNAGTQYLVNKIKAIDGKIPSESQITTMITTALNTYKEGIVTIVESLPQTGEEGKLYLMVDPSDSDVYIVYTWEENAFKRMGSKTFTLTVDSALSSTSTNPVQNKVIKSALDGKANSSHTHGSITNDGKLGTASRVVITGTDKKIGISTVTTTELGYLSGVTSAIQTQLDGKSATGHTHTAGDVAGLATVATTGSYNDLSNKPTINDSTITIQKNGSLVGTFTVNGSAKIIDIPVPTKTSDLTNDSNFVDTSNSAVASGITSAKVTDYDTHIADTDIHVTTADKNKWNNNTYVFRYSSTALVASSTNSNTLLDNTDNLKVGDKVIDSDGVLFSITAIDTQNSTFTIGTALIDLAQDSDVVHKSGNETVAGLKTFENICLSNSIKAINLENQTIDLNNCYSSFGPPQSGNISFYFCNTNNGTANISNLPEQRAFFLISQSIRILSVGSVVYLKQTLVNSNGKTFVRYCNNSVWGSWRDVTNLVTTDTAQTISGNKTFSSDLSISNTDTTANTPNLNLRNYKADRGTTDTAVQSIGFLDKNGKALTSIESRRISNGNTATNILCYNTDDSNNTVSGGVSIIKSKTDTSFSPNADNAVTCGRSLAKWADVQTYRINALEPSSLSLPSGNVSDVIDISSYISDLSGTANLYTPPANGYLTFTFSNGSQVQIYPTTGAGSASKWVAGSGSGIIRGFIPVLKNIEMKISVSATTMDSFYFIPCQGNV